MTRARSTLAARLGGSDSPIAGLGSFETALAGASLLRLQGTAAPAAGPADPGDFGTMTLALGAAAVEEIAGQPETPAGIGASEAVAPSAGSGETAQVIRVGLRPDDPIIKPRSGGRRPSILIGISPQELEALTAPDAPDLPETPPEPELVLPEAPVFDDRIARDALRGTNPAGFAALLAAGALDPPDTGRVAVALQGELEDHGMLHWRA